VLIRFAPGLAGSFLPPPFWVTKFYFDDASEYEPKFPPQLLTQFRFCGMRLFFPRPGPPSHFPLVWSFNHRSARQRFYFQC